MMTQAYYGNNVEPGGDYNHFYRSTHRHMFHTGYYDRSSPYGYYEPTQRYDNRSEYPGRPGVRTTIHEPEETAGGEQRARKRISVACRRCRKRKIKCSGDEGKGIPCLACRHAGADEAQCTFIRVGAKEMNEVLPGLDVTPITNNMSAPSTSHNMDSSIPCSTGASSIGYSGSNYQSHRPSLPTLQTRPVWMDYDSPFDSSAMDGGYGCVPSMIPRQDSFSNAYGLENYRCCYTTAPISAPISAAAYCEPIPSYSFGSLQASSFPQAHQQHNSRLPSLSAESFSPFHMTNLNSSLPPPSTVHDRRLPVPALPAPYTMHYPPGAPQIRPLGSYTDPRVHMNGIHSRNALPASFDAQIGGISSSRAPSIATPAPPSGLPMSSAQQSAATISEPVLGYHFSHSAPTETGSSSPEEVSPTSVAAVGSESYSSSSSTPPSMPQMQQSTPFRYPTTTTTVSSAVAYGGLPISLPDDTSGSETQGLGIQGMQHGDFPLRGHQQQQKQRQFNQAGKMETSFQSRRRSSSYEKQRSSTAYRMSLANLNATF